MQSMVAFMVWQVFAAPAGHQGTHHHKSHPQTPAAAPLSPSFVQSNLPPNLALGQDFVRHSYSHPITTSSAAFPSSLAPSLLSVLFSPDLSQILSCRPPASSQTQPYPLARARSLSIVLPRQYSSSHFLAVALQLDQESRIHSLVLRRVDSPTSHK
ncbi:hypothetical protein K432DRAFT_63547 [Lepidopterella palustris CBS 459.81]|uniref:Uncharacterized protein n=1 Tax=Lepidopterella palustris CBS 459.81 TaxID=1314670 RepID=A0A8E2JED9_9PEZI|nr:hypothetical protein K432DRAFT_63547 [Lepidopterella palustris CBS 459.81]